MICFQETTSSGFGDRLRGIAHLLHMVQQTGETEVLYNDEVSLGDSGYRRAAFPARMTDLIRIEGLSFRYHPLPLPETRHAVIYNSMSDWKEFPHFGFHPGFRHMHRLRPLDEAVTERIHAMHLDNRWLGLHIRETDNVTKHKQYFSRKYEDRTLRSLRSLARRHQCNRIFIAADNNRSYQHWHTLLQGLGFNARGTDPSYDQDKLRQTGIFDMLVDFFGLAACRRIVRVAPSEFSRFASWVGGRRMGYRQLK